MAAAAQKSTLRRRLLDVKSKVPYLQKSGDSAYGKYVDPETVLSAINPLLVEAGIQLEPRLKDVSYERIEQKWVADQVYNADTKKNENHMRRKIETLFRVDIDMEWIDVDSGDEIVVPWHGFGANGDEQGFGSALTYASRYFMLFYFQIPTGKDDPEALSIKKAAEEAKVSGAPGQATADKKEAKAAAAPKKEEPKKEEPKPERAGKKVITADIVAFIIENIKSGKVENSLDVINNILANNSFVDMTDNQFKKLQDKLKA